MARNRLLICTSVAILLLLSQSLGAQESSSALGAEESSLERLEEILRVNTPAPEGSAAEKNRLDAVATLLSDRGVLFERAPVSTGPTVHTFAEYILANPMAVEDSTLTILVPANAPIESLLAGAAGALRRNGSRGTLPVLFIGGTERAEVAAAWVSARLTGLPGERQVAVLNFERLEGGMIVEAGTFGDVTPFYMLQALRSVSTDELRLGIAGNRLQLARLGLSVPEQPVGYLLSRGVPAMQITNLAADSAARSISDAVFDDERPVERRRFVNTLLNLAEELPREAAWERNYTAFQVGPVYLLLGEEELLIIGGVVLISILLYAVSRPRRVRRYSRTMRKNAWQLPLLYAAITVYLFVATALIDTISTARSFPTLWSYAPVITFAAKLLVAITLFGMSHEALRKALFSRNSSFYSGWALFLHLLALILLLVFNLALSFYFVWTFALTFLFGYARHPWMKRAVFLLSLIPPLSFVFTVLEQGENRIAELLILSPTNATLLIALILLPYLLMLFRLDLLHRTPRGKRMARRTVGRRLSTAVLGALGLGVLIFYDPFSPENPVPVTLEERITEEHTLAISTPRPLKESALRIGGSEEELAWPEGDNSFTVALSTPPSVFSLSLERREFLGRSRFIYELASPEPIEQIDATLYGVEGLTIHESDFPVMQQNGEITLVIGRNPPNPLQIELVVEGNEPPGLALDVILQRPVSEVGIISGEAISVSASATVTSRLKARSE